MQIVFLCPPVAKINGGIKYIFRMAEALIRQGQEAVVFEQNKERPTWFPSKAPIVGQEVFKPRADQVLVLPEDQPEILRMFKDWPSRKVVYCQNHFYAAIGCSDSKSYADFNVSHILCSSRTIHDYCSQRHADVPASVIPCSVDPALFRTQVKKPRIAYMPRKRMIESIYIRDMFRHLHPRYRAVEWVALDNKNEQEVARALGEASVFLALSRLDGFGLTPIEAMAADCVVAGFTGIGGREYATPQNGFWADEDDFPVCISQLVKALEMAAQQGPGRDAYRQAAQATAACYTPDIFAEAVKTAWQAILKP